MWNLVVCDDDLGVIDIIKDIVNRSFFPIDDITLLGSCKELEEKMLTDSKLMDICMLDIKLGDGNGINIAEDILKKNPSCQIIFMSGYDEFYQEVYRVDHAYLLQKPLQEVIVKKALNRAINRLKNSQNMQFFICNKSGKYALSLDEICYFEKDKRKIIVTTSDGEKYEYYGKLDEAVERLSNQFIRCHNSFIVGMHHIRYIEKNILTMDDERKIPISRLYSKNVKQGFAKFISK